MPLTLGGAFPVVAVDSSDHAHIAWMDQPSTSIEILYAMISGDSGNVLIDTTQITASDGYDTIYPSIGVDSSDQITVVLENEQFFTFLGIRKLVSMLRINPSLDDQNGNAANSGTITTLPLTSITPTSWSNTMLPFAAVDSSGNVHLCYYGSYNSSVTPPVGSLNFAIFDSTGTSVSPTKNLTQGSTATTTGSFTFPAVAVDSGTSYVTWTDNQRGSLEVFLLFIIP